MPHPGGRTFLLQLMNEVNTDLIMEREEFVVWNGARAVVIAIARAECRITIS